MPAVTGIKLNASCLVISRLGIAVIDKTTTDIDVSILVVGREKETVFLVVAGDRNLAHAIPCEKAKDTVTEAGVTCVTGNLHRFAEFFFTVNDKFHVDVVFIVLHKVNACRLSRIALGRKWGRLRHP